MKLRKLILPALLTLGLAGGLVFSHEMTNNPEVRVSAMTDYTCDPEIDVGINVKASSEAVNDWTICTFYVNAFESGNVSGGDYLAFRLRTNSGTGSYFDFIPNVLTSLYFKGTIDDDFILNPMRWKKILPKYGFPVDTVVICIYGETAILKVIGMSAECEELTLEYDEVVEFFPDFTDPERNMYSRYLFLDIETLDLIDNPYNYYAYKNEELEADCSNEEEEESKTEINEQQSYPDASPDDLPF